MKAGIAFFQQQELQQHDFLSHECAVVLPKKLIEEAAEGDKVSVEWQQRTPPPRRGSRR